MDDAWHGELAEERPALYHYLESVKATGSLWLHCADTASHYPKVLKGSGTQMTAGSRARCDSLPRRASMARTPVFV